MLGSIPSSPHDVHQEIVWRQPTMSVDNLLSLTCNAGKLFVSFAPAVSGKAAKAMRQQMRRWQLHHRNDLALTDVVKRFRPCFSVGFATTDASGLLPFAKPCVLWIISWCVGRSANTNDFELTR